MYPGFRFELNLSKWKFIAYIVKYINVRFILYPLEEILEKIHQIFEHNNSHP